MDKPQNHAMFITSGGSYYYYIYTRTIINRIFSLPKNMNRLFPQNPTSSLYLSQQQKKFQEHKSSSPSLYTQKSESPSLTTYDLYQEDNMSVQVSDELR